MGNKSSKSTEDGVLKKDSTASRSASKINAIFDYEQVTTVSSQEFALLCSSFDLNRFTKSDAIDIRRVELLLDLREGVLADEELFLETYQCQGCRKPLVFSDFVYTAINDARHSKSFIVHTLLGTKLIRNKHRSSRCTNCDTLSVKPLNYMTNAYTCCNQGKIQGY
jgi:hypothetical protein